MARHLLMLAVLLAATLSQATPAQADWNSFWARFKLDRKRMNCWPDPFMQVDRDLTRTAIQRMVVKGWQRQNTLGDSHFHPQTHLLTEAGELKVRGILTLAPPQHRQVYVLRSMRPEETEVRVDSVQQYVARSMPDQPLPNIVATDVQPPGWPASYVDEIDRKSHSSIPAPRLPAAKRRWDVVKSNRRHVTSSSALG